MNQGRDSEVFKHVTDGTPSYFVKAFSRSSLIRIKASLTFDLSRECINLVAITMLSCILVPIISVDCS